MLADQVFLATLRRRVKVGIAPTKGEEYVG